MIIHSYEHARICNLPPMIATVIKNGQGIISMVSVTVNMPECTTH